MISKMSLEACVSDGFPIVNRYLETEKSRFLFPQSFWPNCRLLCAFVVGRTMSRLILSCVKTGRAFNAGFEATSDDLRFVPPKWTARLRCKICGNIHEIYFAEARICERPDNCRKYKDCQGCEFAR
jgi:hypothetical protein